jgi:hypothetical protein
VPLKPFSFENTTAKTPEERNWRVFSENSKTLIYPTLTITSGVNSPDVTKALFTLYGPIVFYQIQLQLNNTDGWTTGTYISVPIPAFTPAGGAGFGPYNHLGQVYIPETGVVLTTATFSINPTRLYFTAAYTNSTGSSHNVNIQGWYYRG